MLKDLINEMAAGGAAGVTSAGAVAGYRERIGDGKKKKSKKKKVARREIGLPYSFHLVKEGISFSRFLNETTDTDFNRADVIAKLKTAAKSAEMKGEDSAGFALEDEKGSIVKVWVPEDQADNFGQMLQHALAGADENEDDQNDSIEIAEVLWKLRKEFDIINVEWGEIPEDEEEPMDAQGATDLSIDAEGPEGEASLDLSAEGGEGEDMTADAGEVDELGAEEATAGGEEAAASALVQVIDMMKADAEARKAEAEARAAEANARSATEKVKQEEEVLDMEAYYDDKKEVDNESKQIAKLAKYKHDMAADEGNGLRSQPPAPRPEADVDMDVDMDVEPEMEEVVRPRRPDGRNNDTTITRGELGAMLLKALRR